MDLHSYAKHSRPFKKWSLENKRSLVEARIRNDDAFQMNPKTSNVPWRRVISQGKLDDYNVSFVRKQWAYIILKYKQYKSTHSNNKQALDAQTIKKITKDWEFFEQIHNYMTRKTTKLHSYALTSTHDDETTSPAKTGKRKTEKKVNDKPVALQVASKRETQSDPSVYNATLDSSDNTIDDPSNIASRKLSRIQDDTAELSENDQRLRHNLEAFFQNHDYAERKDFARQQSYFADIEEEDTLESLKEPISEYTINSTQTNDGKYDGITIKQEPLDQSNVNATEHEEIVYFGNPTNSDLQQDIIEKPTISSSSAYQTARTSNSHDHQNKESQSQTNLKPQHPPKRVLTERDKYYRHKRRFNRRMEQRFDALLHVAGQIAKAEYPNIDVSHMLKDTSVAVRHAFHKIFSSDDDIDSSETESADSPPKA